MLLRDLQASLQFDGSESAALGRRLGQAGAALATQRADRVTPGWSDHARMFAETFIGKVSRFTAEDLRDAAAGIVAEPPDARAWGTILRSLAISKRIRRVGYGFSRNPGSHARPVAIWEVNHVV